MQFLLILFSLRAMFYECYNSATGAVGRPRAWGSKVGDEYKTELLSSGWHTKVCSNEEEEEEELQAHTEQNGMGRGKNGQEFADEVVKSDVLGRLPVNWMHGSKMTLRRPTPAMRGFVDFVSRYV